MEEFMEDSTWDWGDGEMKSEKHSKEILDKFQVQRQHMQSWRGEGEVAGGEWEIIRAIN